MAGDAIHPILASWRRLSPRPGGVWLFNRVLGRRIPYTGSISPRVVELRPGYARVEMRDRRAVRNHLDSIHAVALLNLAEVTSGLAMTCGLSASTRGIVTRLEIEYVKKARGTLVAVSECSPPEVTEERFFEVTASLRDAAEDEVARATARWKIGPRPGRG